MGREMRGKDGQTKGVIAEAKVSLKDLLRDGKSNDAGTCEVQGELEMMGVPADPAPPPTPKPPSRQSSTRDSMLLKKGGSHRVLPSAGKMAGGRRGSHSIPEGSIVEEGASEGSEEEAEEEEETPVALGTIIIRVAIRAPEAPPKAPPTPSAKRGAAAPGFGGGAGGAAGGGNAAEDARSPSPEATDGPSVAGMVDIFVAKQTGASDVVPGVVVPPAWPPAGQLGGPPPGPFHPRTSAWMPPGYNQPPPPPGPSPGPPPGPPPGVGLDFPATPFGAQAAPTLFTPPLRPYDAPSYPSGMPGAPFEAGPLPGAPSEPPPPLPSGPQPPSGPPPPRSFGSFVRTASHGVGMIGKLAPEGSRQSGGGSASPVGPRPRTSQDTMVDGLLLGQQPPPVRMPPETLHDLPQPAITFL